MQPSMESSRSTLPKGGGHWLAGYEGVRRPLVLKVLHSDLKATYHWNPATFATRSQVPGADRQMKNR